MLFEQYPCIDTLCTQPEAVAKFIGQVIAAPFEELPSLLDSFHWTFDKVPFCTSWTAPRLQKLARDAWSLA